MQKVLTSCLNNTGKITKEISLSESLTQPFRVLLKQQIHVTLLYKKVLLGYFHSNFCYSILNRWFLFIVPIRHFQCNFVRETFSTHLCTIMKLEPFKNTSYVPLHSPVTLRCSLNIEPMSYFPGDNMVIMIDCFEQLLSVAGWIAIYFFLFCYYWSWRKCLPLLFLFLWNFILLGMYIGTHLLHWSSINLFTFGPATFLLNSKKHPITSRYFLGLVSGTSFIEKQTKTKRGRGVLACLYIRFF